MEKVVTDQPVTNLLPPPDLTEITADFKEEEDEEKKEERRRREDCCCYYIPDDDDVSLWCFFCQCISDCFDAIGQCTEGCFEGCAECCNNSCDSSPDVADGADTCVGCLECCSVCGSD